MAYLIALHLIAIVCWFAGLFYLPRLLVYHSKTQSQEVSEQFKVMEHRLYCYIMMPAMIVTVVSGLCLMALYLFANLAPVGWLWVKLFLVLLLMIFHFYCGHCISEFQQDRPIHSERFYRIFNEIPTVLLILIMTLAIVRPFWLMILSLFECASVKMKRFQSRFVV